MKLDLDRTPSGRSELVLAGDIALDWATGRPERVHLEGILRVDNLEGRVLVTGQAEASGEAVCSRCLEGFPLCWPVDIECMVLRDPESEEGRDDSMVLHQRAGEVDLREICRESIILAYPQTTVCGEDCRGICAGCGRNLNHEACVCEAETHDPRWDALP